MTDTRLSGVRRHICRADKRRFLQQRQTGRRIFFMNTHRPVFYALSSLHERIYGNTEIMIFIKPVSKGTHSKKPEAVSKSHDHTASGDVKMSPCRYYFITA